MKSKPARLIVNADDYGYFGCVSAGIRRAARDGILTATGILANGRSLATEIQALLEETDLDLGVHLNLTHGGALTRAARNRLCGANGELPSKFRLAAMVTTGYVRLDVIRDEWRAQIERCLDTGARLRFLNAHEHVHMLPSLFRLAKSLGSEYAITHLRFTTADPVPSTTVGARLRDAALAASARANRGRMNVGTPKMLGLGVSGRLDQAFLERTLPELTGGEAYELMCHPGACSGAAETSPALARYHDWTLELETLTAPATTELLARNGVELIGYRQLDPVAADHADPRGSRRDRPT
jgi:predicted glycoside hydrolase/deacetylase ChbG (UPF0249 family)